MISLTTALTLSQIDFSFLISVVLLSCAKFRFSTVFRECSLMTWQTYHSISLKFLRLVPVKSRLLKLAPLGCQKLRGKQEVVLGNSLDRSPMRRSQPPPKVGPYDLKQQMALFLRDLTRLYLAWSVTEKRKVSRLKSVLKWVEFLWNWSSQESGVQPPMILLSSVWQRMRVSSQASHISWKSLTLNLWLLARQMSLRLISQSKKEVMVSKLFTMLLVVMWLYSICRGVLLWICSSRLLVLHSPSMSSYYSQLLGVYTYLLTGRSRIFR